MQYNHSLYYLIRYNTISKTRKILDDWELRNTNLRRVLISIPFILLSASILIFFISFNLSNKFPLPKGSYSSLLVTFIFIEQVLSSMSFFKNNKKIFLKDERKIIHQRRSVRILQFKSALILKTFWKSILTSFLFLLPILLSLYLTDNSELKLITLPLIIIMNFLINFLFSMLFAYIPYIVSIIWSKALRSIFIKIVFFIINLIVPIMIGLILFYLLKRFDVVQSLYEISTSTIFQHLNNVVPYHLFYNHIITAIITIFVATIVCLAVYKLWDRSLNKYDLIEYTEIDNQIYPNKMKIDRKNKTYYSILQKDRAFLFRMEGYFFNNFGNMLFLIMLFLGFGFPFILKYFEDYPIQASLLLVFVISSLFYQLVGDAIKIILSVELDLKNFHLFHSNISNLWQLARPKLTNYNIIVCLLSTFLSLILLFWQSSQILLHFVFLVILLSNGFLHGLIQISSIILYPKLNWEHLYELGESSKAKTFTNIYEAFVFVFNLQLIGIVGFLLYKFKNMSLVILLSFTLIIVIFTILNYIFSILYLRKLNMNERYVIDDRD
ncbi:hypothetical protein JCM21714_1415 [Gracilibacillus boraciitolerans JCM 21714]|uniref:Uncharacterized protein n=2 Tax=Gracilibacillus boraciitolerans TaxID=307521 RepID=W4VGV0_9BACI|nr:hypothetical protein JCM21714_1415 [Gracilibacillus boraciitolerans JCM 21714]